MNQPERLIMSILGEAVEYGAPHERAAFLDQACAGDDAQRARVEALLRAYEAAGSFLQGDRPSPEMVATVSQLVTERPGTVIGPYKLLEQIGEGGFGVVYLAEQTEPVRRKVALKLLKPGMDTRQVVVRFEAERQALAIMDHPNIAKVFDGGATPAGRPYFVMELVKGVPITDFCDQHQLSPRERLALFIPVCQAVQHAHQKGIIHRDLKPSNVLVSRHDTTPVVKVIDFGVAKALGQELTDKTLFTGVAQMVGTPLYMSPEQAGMSDLDIDTRSDIYALGVLLYELLTGATPFDKERLRTAGYDEIRRIIREEEPARPSTRFSTLGQAAATVSASRQTDPRKLGQLLRGELDWIVMRALEKDRNRRYESASAFAADVQRYLDDEPVLACPPSAWYRFRKFARRNWRALVTASVFALAAIIGVGALAVSTALVWQADKDVRQANKDLKDALDGERREAYFQRITVAHHEMNYNPAAALRALQECPEDLRGWEWYYLMRLSRLEPLVLDAKIEINGVAFSPKGEWLASGDVDGTITIWNSRTGAIRQTIPHAHTDAVVSVAFHPDGRHLASVGADRQAKVWDLTTGQAVFKRPCDPIRNCEAAYTVAFNPQGGRQLAVAGDGEARVWDWENDRLVHTLPGHDRHAICVAFSHDGRLLATGSGREGPRLWDATAGGPPLRTFLPGHRGPLTALAFSPDGTRLASASLDWSVKVWDTTTGALRHTCAHTGNVLCVAYSPDGARLASAAEDKTVRIWSPEGETAREVLSLRHAGRCACLAFSPDGRRVAAASADGTIRIWDATPLQGNEGQEVVSFNRHRDEIRRVAYSRDGQWIVSAGRGADVYVWDALTGRKKNSGLSDDTMVVFDLAWRRDGQQLAFATDSGQGFTVKVWDVRTWHEEAVRLPAGREYFAVTFSPDGDYLVTGRQKGAVQVWDAATGAEIITLGRHAQSVRAVVFSKDGKHLASVSHDGEVKLWDGTRLRKTQEARCLPRRVPGPGVNVAFSPDGRRLATRGERNTIQIWDVPTGQELGTLGEHGGEIYTLAFSPDEDGRWITSGGADSIVRVWDSHTGKLVRSFRGHTGLVTSVAFSPDGRHLVSGSRDRTAKVWDLTSLSKTAGR